MIKISLIFILKGPIINIPADNNLTLTRLKPLS